MLLGRPPEISAHGSVDGSLDLLLIVLGAIFCVALAWLVVASVRGRERASPGAPPRVAVLVALAIVFFLAVDLPLMTREASTETEHGPVVPVRLTGRQWAWESRHAGRDRVLGSADDVVTMSELRIPAGRSIALELESVDVVHAVNLPNLRMQRDIVPGHAATVQFIADTTGDFELTCSQFCGATHFQMVAPLRVMPSAEFDAWMNEASDRALRVASHE